MSDRGNCDVCDKRPYTHKAIVYGIETCLCDLCGGFEDSEEKETPNPIPPGASGER